DKREQGGGARRAGTHEDERKVGSGQASIMEEVDGRNEPAGVMGVQAEERGVRRTREKGHKELVLVHMASPEGVGQGSGLGDGRGSRRVAPRSKGGNSA